MTKLKSAADAIRDLANGGLQIITPRRRHKLELGQCVYCDREREQNNNFHPYHDASDHCKSGKHPHCTCDTCF